MIRLERIKFKNLLSFGNNYTEYKIERGITRIKGKNGSGKSSIIEAIYFGLFGRPYRNINLNQLINSINKSNLEVIIEFKKNNDNYRIERGLKPNFLRIYRNNELVPILSKSRSYQDVLETQILGITPLEFCQAYLKSMNDVSFMSLSKNEKRKILEKIFEIEIFSFMQNEIKSKINELEAKNEILLNNFQNTQLLIENEIETQKKFEDFRKNLEQKKKEIIEEIDRLKEENKQNEIALKKIEKYKDRKKKIEDSIKDIKNKIKGLDDEKIEIKSKINIIENKINLLKESCGDCQKIFEIEINENLEEKKKNLEKILEYEKKLKDDLEKLKEEKDKIEKIIIYEKTVIKNIANNNEKISKLKREFNEFTEEINQDKERINEYKKIRDELKKEIEENKIELEYLKQLKFLTSDEIKSFIIKKYLPILNKILNTYLQKLQLGISFYFDKDFNEIIYSKNKENFSYFSFSEGQKKRIDLAIFFTLLDFYNLKKKKSNFNILILDEVSAGLDMFGENILYDLLRDIAIKEDKEIITISHSEAIDVDKIDRIYEVKLDKYFSTILK